MTRIFATLMAPTLALMLAPQTAHAGALELLDDITPQYDSESWTGGYVGGDLGGAVGHGATAETIGTPAFVNLVGTGVAPDSLSFDSGGFSIASQIGANWQRGRTVFGIEAEVARLGIDGESSFTGAPVLGTRLTTSAGFEVGTNVNIRGRVGYLATPTFMLYVQGGLALANIKTIASVVGVDAPTLVWQGEGKQTEAGITVGAGGEWRIGERLSVKLSYNYFSFGEREIIAEGNAAVRSLAALNGVDYETSTDVQGSSIRTGINVRF